MSKIEELIGYLNGTCLSDSVAVPAIYGEDFNDLMDLSDVELATLDDAIFLCAGCSWWCEVWEAVDDNGEDVCRDCAEERGIEEHE